MCVVGLGCSVVEGGCLFSTAEFVCNACVCDTLCGGGVVFDGEELDDDNVVSVELSLAVLARYCI